MDKKALRAVQDQAEAVGTSVIAPIRGRNVYAFSRSTLNDEQARLGQRVVGNRDSAAVATICSISSVEASVRLVRTAGTSGWSPLEPQPASARPTASAGVRTAFRTTASP